MGTQIHSSRLPPFSYTPDGQCLSLGFLASSRSRHAVVPGTRWAHQVLDGLATAWTEHPWDTEAFILVPRIFQRDWGRVSKHVLELGTFAADTIPDYGVDTDIPCVLLHLPCYVRSLSPLRRLDPPSQYPEMEWHREQAEHVRRLS
jgi:hypothetical protein